jgi:predicted nucleic acid-binding protein
MKLFLDSSVVLAACGRSAGASRSLFDLAQSQGWQLLVSDYVLGETEKNLKQRMPLAALHEWTQLRGSLSVVADVWTFNWPVIFPASKDRPVLFSAAAVADVLITLDRADFGSLMVTGFYGLPVMKPGEFLRRERAAGRLT